MDHIYQDTADALLFTPTPPRGVEDPQQLPAVTPTAAAEAILERIDGWCEDRQQRALSDEDGRD